MSQREEAALWSGGTAADTAVLLDRRQQGEQAVAVGGSDRILWALCR